MKLGETHIGRSDNDHLVVRGLRLSGDGTRVTAVAATYDNNGGFDIGVISRQGAVSARAAGPATTRARRPFEPRPGRDRPAPP